MEAFGGKVGRVVAVSSGDVYAALGQLIGIEPSPPSSARAGLLDEHAPLRAKL